jgi:hypothetical protein
MARVAEVEKPSEEVKVNSHGTRIALKGLGMERELVGRFALQKAGKIGHETHERTRKEIGAEEGSWLSGAPLMNADGR